MTYQLRGPWQVPRQHNGQAMPRDTAVDARVRGVRGLYRRARAAGNGEGQAEGSVGRSLLLRRIPAARLGGARQSQAAGLLGCFGASDRTWTPGAFVGFCSALRCAAGVACGDHQHRAACIWTLFFFLRIIYTRSPPPWGPSDAPRRSGVPGKQLPASAVYVF